MDDRAQMFAPSFVTDDESSNSSGAITEQFSLFVSPPSTMSNDAAKRLETIATALQQQNYAYLARLDKVTSRLDDVERQLAALQKQPNARKRPLRTA